MLRGNDENVRPDVGPNDQDRERFGFTKRKSKVPRQSSCGLLSIGGLPDERCSYAAPLSARGECIGGTAPVALVPLVDSTLGDPDAKLHLLRAKPAAPKYDFKGRINELTDQNRALKTALADEREKRKQLADVLSRFEADINFRLRSVAGEAEDFRRQLDAQGKLEKMVQEAVRSVWREQDPPASGKQQEEAPSPTRLEAAELRAQLEALRQCSAAETGRALRAELLLREREEELVRVREDLLEAQRQLNQQHEASAAREDAALERAREAAELVRDAGGLLQQQEEEYSEKFRALSAMAEQREVELAAELSKASSKNLELQARLSKFKA